MNKLNLGALAVVLLAVLTALLLRSDVNTGNAAERSGGPHELAAEALPLPQALGEQPVSPAYLNRLGAAVLSHEPPGPVWVLVNTVFPHEVEGLYPNRDSAVFIRDMEGLGDFAIEGPFVIPGDPDPRVMVPCWHSCSQKICLPGAGLFPIRFDEVIDFRLTINFKDGDPFERVFEPGEADAIFLTMPAIERYLLPDIADVYGLDYMESVRDSLQEQIDRIR